MLSLGDGCHEQTRIILDLGKLCFGSSEQGEVQPTREQGRQEDILEDFLEEVPSEQNGRMDDMQAMGGERNHNAEAQRS